MQIPHSFLRPKSKPNLPAHHPILPAGGPRDSNPRIANVHGDDNGVGGGPPLSSRDGSKAPATGRGKERVRLSAAANRRGENAQGFIQSRRGTLHVFPLSLRAKKRITVSPPPWTLRHPIRRAEGGIGLTNDGHAYSFPPTSSTFDGFASSALVRDSL